MPLIDAYSDYIPEDFTAHMEALGGFPSREAFAVLEPIHGRYGVLHVDVYSPDARAALERRLYEFAPYMKQWYRGDRTWLYEIVEYPR